MQVGANWLQLWFSLFLRWGWKVERVKAKRGGQRSLCRAFFDAFCRRREHVKFLLFTSSLMNSSQDSLIHLFIESTTLELLLFFSFSTISSSRLPECPVASELLSEGQSQPTSRYFQRLVSWSVIYSHGLRVLVLSNVLTTFCLQTGCSHSRRSFEASAVF